MKNYYTLINCPLESEASLITEVCKAIFVKNHPAADPSKEANIRFWEINEAYAILLNPKTKQVYDRLLFKYASQETPLMQEDLPSIKILKHAILKRRKEVIHILKGSQLNIPALELFPNNNGYNSSDTGLQHFTEYLFHDIDLSNFNFDFDFNFDFS